MTSLQETLFIVGIAVAVAFAEIIVTCLWYLVRYDGKPYNLADALADIIGLNTLVIASYLVLVFLRR